MKLLLFIFYFIIEIIRILIEDFLFKENRLENGFVKNL